MNLCYFDRQKSKYSCISRNNVPTCFPPFSGEMCWNLILGYLGMVIPVGHDFFLLGDGIIQAEVVETLYKLKNSGITVCVMQKRV